jgi:hypothetical protein
MLMGVKKEGDRDPAWLECQLEINALGIPRTDFVWLLPPNKMSVQEKKESEQECTPGRVHSRQSAHQAECHQDKRCLYEL